MKSIDEFKSWNGQSEPTFKHQLGKPITTTSNDEEVCFTFYQSGAYIRVPTTLLDHVFCRNIMKSIVKDVRAKLLGVFMDHAGIQPLTSQYGFIFLNRLRIATIAILSNAKAANW